MEEGVEREVQAEVRREVGAALVIEAEAALEVEGSVVGASAPPEAGVVTPTLRDPASVGGAHDANVRRYGVPHL